MRLVTLPSNHDYFWMVIGWAVLYAALKWLRTDGSDCSVKLFDDSFWPDAILIGWPAVYWPVSRVLLASVI
jgi:hypothetical protein